MYPHALDRYYMMGYIMRQLRGKRSQEKLGALIESRHGLKKSSRTQSSLQRSISNIENFDHLKERANQGQNPVMRNRFIRTATDGLSLSQRETDALLWLIEGKAFQSLNKSELALHPSLANAAPRKYEPAELRKECLRLLQQAVRTNADERSTPVHMVTGWDEEHQVNFREKLLDLEGKPGQRLLVSKYPSFLTFPGNALKYMEEFKQDLSAEAQAKISELTLERQQNFNEKVRHYGERCIHSRESLRRYLDKSSKHALPWPQRRQHVQNLITLLRRFTHFEVALASVEPEMELVIKSGQAASLRGTAREIYRTRDSVICGPLYIFWDHPKRSKTTVYSFMADFEYAWDKIPKSQRDKKKVITELERLLRDSEK